MQTLTIRTPDDILAYVPEILGFHPSESLVMLTFDGPRPFHARVDLPGTGPDQCSVDEVIDSLLYPCLQHEVPKVLMVIYSDTDVEPHLAKLAGQIVVDFTSAGIQVFDVLWLREQKWWRSFPRGVSGTLTLTKHESVIDRPVQASREALMDQLLPIDPVTPNDDDFTLEGADFLEDRKIGALLERLNDSTFRDSCLIRVTQENAQQWAPFWIDVVRRSPASHVANAAAVLGYVAWQAGDGALSWCAVDRANMEGGTSLTQLIDYVLTNAIAPGTIDLTNPEEVA